jgi:hypothetical protein
MLMAPELFWKNKCHKNSKQKFQVHMSTFYVRMPNFTEADFFFHLYVKKRGHPSKDAATWPVAPTRSLRAATSTEAVLDAHVKSPPQPPLPALLAPGTAVTVANGRGKEATRRSSWRRLGFCPDVALATQGCAYPFGFWPPLFFSSSDSRSHLSCVTTPNSLLSNARTSRSVSEQSAQCVLWVNS